MNSHQIILTNLNPSVYRRGYVPTFLAELAVNSLLYEEVLIREADLILNRNLTRFLRDPIALATFQELLACGAVRILTLPPSALGETAFDPGRQPISARADDHVRRRSYKGRPWKPLTWEWELYRTLDEVLTTHQVARRQQRPFPSHNDFATGLREVLAHREQYRLERHRPFHDIDDQIARAFIRFCEAPGAWERFLHEKGVNPIRGPEGEFYRTQAYQCTMFFEHGNGMRRLVESVYAANDCNREAAEGRYGRSALAELPYCYTSEDEEHAAAEAITKMDLVSVPSALPDVRLGIGPGIGEVLGTVRQHRAFRAMQEAIDRLTVVRDADQQFRSAWSSLAGVMADTVVRHTTRRSRLDTAVTHLAVGLYLGARTLGYVVFHAQHELDWPVLADYLAINRIEHWTPALSRYVRAALRLPKAYEAWRRAATLRCTFVTPPASGRAT